MEIAHVNRYRRQGTCQNCQRLEEQVRKLQSEIRTLKSRLRGCSAEKHGLADENQKLQATAARLQAEVARLRAENQELRRKLEESTREQHRQTTPFRRRTRVANPKRPGRQKGHPASLRKPPRRVDRTLTAPLPDCPECHGQLTHRRVRRQFQIDLPPLDPIITRFDVETGYCPHCRRHRQGHHPEQISDALGAANIVIGPRALALALQLKYHFGLGFRKIARLLTQHFGLKLEASTLARMAQRWGKRVRPTYEGLKLDLRTAGRVTHADETGWPESGRLGWLWVFASNRTTVFAIRQTRGHQVVLEILGEHFGPPLVCDGLGSYDALPSDYIRPRCSAHILRRIRKLSDILRGQDLQQLQRLEALWKEALALAKRRGEMTPRGYDRRVSEIQHRFAAWLADHGKHPGPELARLAKHLAKHKHAWFLFLYDEEIPPTNTLAERQFQIALPSRKLGAGTRTERGSDAHCIWSSIVATLAQRSRDFQAWLARTMRSPPHMTVSL